ncbi:MAG TPA: CARDB domain-containing protein, partial [Candidatus Kapabacteria bacterium]|nr:CARDB domain-containing protein [Candidatus Kapabacteria bacterium]
GRRVPVSVTVTNDGNILAKGNLAVNFGLSATQDGATPASLGSLTKRINLKPGKSTVVHFSVPLALGVATGSQYVVATVDPSNAFLDPNLVNNVFTDQQPITIT